jgi:hypothetical protein
MVDQKKFDPFKFDMSVSSDKKRRAKTRRGMSGAVETSQRECSFDGCQEPGQFRAPKSPDVLDDFFWFCKQHVREYNVKWNFFETDTQEDLERQMASTDPLEKNSSIFKRNIEEKAWSRLGVDDPLAVLGGNATRNPGRIPGSMGRKLPPTERQALEILDGHANMGKVQLRSLYKSLVKDLHPDMNKGNRSDEDQLQKVVWAWDQIKDSRNFSE